MCNIQKKIDLLRTLSEKSAFLYWKVKSAALHHKDMALMNIEVCKELQQRFNSFLNGLNKGLDLISFTQELDEEIEEMNHIFKDLMRTK